MGKGRSSRFFRAYVNNQSYKVFLDDVSAIYRVSLRKTPPLGPYLPEDKPAVEDTDESNGMEGVGE
jgi:hypothetical protein